MRISDWSSDVCSSDLATSHLKRLTNSGGALSPSLIGGLRARFPAAKLYAMYGLTEAFRSTYLDPALIDAHPEAMGKAIPFAEVMVVRADGSRAAPDQPGELVHAGPLVARGYWNDPERTAQRFRPAPAFSREGGIAVWSGDTVIERSEEHTSELQSLMRISYAVFCMKKKTQNPLNPNKQHIRQ